MCIPFSLKIIKGILPYSSVIVTYYHSGECRRGVFPYFIYHDHDHLYLSVDGRWPINVLHYPSKGDSFFFFFFVHSTVSAVVQAVNTWFIPRFVTWSQRKGVRFTWRTLAFRRVYAGRYGFHAEKVQIVAQLPFPCRIWLRALSN